MFFVSSDDIKYSVTLVSGYYLDLSIEKLQMFPFKVNPDRHGIEFPLSSTSLQLLYIFKSGMK